MTLLHIVDVIRLGANRNRVAWRKPTHGLQGESTRYKPVLKWECKEHYRARTFVWLLSVPTRRTASPECFLFALNPAAISSLPIIGTVPSPKVYAYVVAGL